MNQILALLSSPDFWKAIGVIVAGVVFVPGGIAQDALASLVSAASNWLQRRLPANQYQLVTSLAQVAITAAAQQGASLGWTNEQKKQSALDGLTAVVKQHGISRFDATTLDDVIESVYNQLKSTLNAGTSVAAPATALALPVVAEKPGLNEAKTPS